MNFLELASARHSCREYTEKMVEEEKLDLLIKAARLAPTAKNKQPFKLYIARSPEALAKIDEITFCRYKASTVIMIAYDKDNVYVYPEERERFTSGEEDCAIVLTHIMLEAKELGLDTLYINRFSPLKAKEVFHLPENMIPVALLDVGYEVEKENSIAILHYQSKEKEELVEIL